MALRDRIAEEAKRKEGLRFDRFMEMALYDPEEGYYMSRPAPTGRDGDFVTSPETSPLFAACVGEFFERAAGADFPGLFHLVEIGPGRGTLARDLLAALQGAPLLDKLVLHLVERGPRSREALSALFKPQIDEGTVLVHSDVRHLPPRLNGGLLANELFDNLPVRRVMQADGLMEIVVRFRRGRFEEDLVPAPADLVAYIEQHARRLRSGQTAEVGLEAPRFLDSVLSRFGRCHVLIADYGDDASRLYSHDAFPNGTLAAHRRHGSDQAFYEEIGRKDLTAHVNFSALRTTLDKRGFEVDPLATQADFLLAHGLAERMAAQRETATGLEGLQSHLRAKTLFHPEAMGEAFRVLTASRLR